MSDKAWKACERRIAKYIGGERVPVSGRARGYAPDIEHDFLSVEVKYRAKIPAWIHDAMNQAEASRTDEKVSCVIVCEKWQSAGDSYIFFRLEDARDRWL